MIRNLRSYWKVTSTTFVEFDGLEGLLSVYHDAILKGGRMPVEMVCARHTNQELTRDLRAQWRFAEGR